MAVMMPEEILTELSDLRARVRLLEQQAYGWVDRSFWVDIPDEYFDLAQRYDHVVVVDVDALWGGA